MTTENIFAHEKYIGATVWLGRVKLVIARINSKNPVYPVMAIDELENEYWFMSDGYKTEDYKCGQRLSWIKQDFVLGDPPKPKLKPLEFKGVLFWRLSARLTRSK